MRKPLLFLLASLVTLIVAACAGLEGVSGFGRGASGACASMDAPWTGLAALPVESSSADDEPTLRAVTLNLHSGMGQWKGLWSSRAAVQRRLDQIADTLAAVAPAPVDIVALNEVDFSARRSGDIDQARYLAEALARRGGIRYEVIEGRTRRPWLAGNGGGYGNALLVRHTVIERQVCLYDDTRACGVADAAPDMPVLRGSTWPQRVLREGRGLIKVTLDFHGQPLDVIVTHLEAVALAEREAQAAHLLRRFVDPARTTLLLGDLNAVPTSMTHARVFAVADRTHDILTSGPLADARVLLDAGRGGRADFRAWATYPTPAPFWPLDAALGSLDLVPREARVLPALDSDHRGFYVAYRYTHQTALVATQRARHDTIRQRQLARILQCDIDGSATRAAKMEWLRAGTLFDLAAVDTTYSASAQ